VTKIKVVLLYRKHGKLLLKEEKTQRKARKERDIRGPPWEREEEHQQDIL